MSDPLALSGAPGSPYTRKMLAVLRYRRIPYRFLMSGSAAQAAMPQPKVQLLPTFYLPDETGTLQAVTDSTPTSAPRMCALDMASRNAGSSAASIVICV